jgi:hypothetical protein
MIDKIAEGLGKLAEAISSSETPKDIIDSIIKGQEQQQVQEEICLITQDIVLILDILSNARPARIYISIRRDNLRIN